MVERAGCTQPHEQKSTVRCYRKVRLYKRLKKKKWALSRFFLFRGASILDSLLQDPTYSRVAFGHPPVLHEVTLSLHVASLLIPTVILFPFSFFIALFALFILGSAHSFLYPVRCRLPPSSPPHTTPDDNFSFFFPSSLLIPRFLFCFRSHKSIIYNCVRFM